MLKILYLEDNDLDVLLLKRALAEAKLEADVHAVTTCSEYQKAIGHAQFDLILSDAGLPGFSALEALDIARRQCPKTPFIFLSGCTHETKIQSALAAGGTDYVVKGNNSHLAQAILRIQAGSARPSNLKPPENRLS
ncbi:MAG TPA: response regulator [Candidatus Limnocylindrales bacterium]|jgi:CheY-like chemotaxis protein|nr:response regulator [Candidatus Limnocylindrales bacterium]